MVFSGVPEREELQKFMEMSPERRKPLHNIKLPGLNWGNQRLVRCMKVNSNGEIPTVDLRSSASEAESESFSGRRRESDSTKQKKSCNGFKNDKKLILPPIGAYGEKSAMEGDAGDGIADDRAKLMSTPEEVQEDESAAAAAARPWSDGGRGGGSGVDVAGCSSSKNEERQQNSSDPQRTDNSNIKKITFRLRGSSPTQGSVEKVKKKYPKFSLSLSRKEIEGDLLTMMGPRAPSRRPKKKARIVQQEHDKLAREDTATVGRSFKLYLLDRDDNGSCRVRDDTAMHSSYVEEVSSFPLAG
ncbi:hypothetical protein NE237_014027 [Protea cynaroides]|uniref:Uncharacterized protein n=1 Tax=Protea cynaroides TaxID=273540 RepID=A0A9Q0JYH9_9MAGN|nr:hypothetical protein NE237_014027 [Protea cynaroides]